MDEVVRKPVGLAEHQRILTRWLGLKSEKAA
jgi:hypothetical protein